MTTKPKTDEPRVAPLMVFDAAGVPLWLVPGSLSRGGEYAPDEALTAVWLAAQARMYGPLFGLRRAA